VTDWQPIYTAPKDGTDILLGSQYSERFYACVGFWLVPLNEDDIEGWTLPAEQMEPVIPPPTHWMPLPDPP